MTKLKKLILATAIALPSIGYCGFIDWATGYPEIKEKLNQRLEENYKGDKFEITSLDYVSNTGYYNFEAKDLTNGIEGGGSYFPDSGRIAANVFKEKMIDKNLEKMLRPFISQVSDNYYFKGHTDYVIPNPITKERSEMIDNVLGYKYSSGVDVQEWSHKYHREGLIIARLKIQSKQDPESMYKVVKMIYEINNYLRSFKMGMVIIDVEAFDAPEDFDINKWGLSNINKTSNDKEIYQYAWGYISMTSCPKTEWNSYCLSDEHELARSFADKINSVQDVTKYLEIYDDYGKPTAITTTALDGKRLTRYYWRADNRHKTTPLDKTQYYPAVEKLIIENK